MVDDSLCGYSYMLFKKNSGSVFHMVLPETLETGARCCVQQCSDVRTMHLPPHARRSWNPELPQCANVSQISLGLKKRIFLRRYVGEI
jgi:hypothetical protein